VAPPRPRKRMAGHQLELGVEITKDTTHTVSLTAIHVGVPSGGLAVRTTQFGTFGTVGGNTGPQPLAPGNSTRMSAMFDNQLPCRAPRSEIRFTTDDDGQTATGALSNLPAIAFTECSPPSG
jgi:hypothetical protein